MNDQPKDQRPTPETDRIARAACDDKGMLCRPQLLWDALERLERDLAEAREQLAEAREDALAHAELLTAKDRQLAAERALADRLASAIQEWDAACQTAEECNAELHSESYDQATWDALSNKHDAQLDMADASRISAIAAHRAARGAQNAQGEARADSATSPKPPTQ